MGTEGPRVPQSPWLRGSVRVLVRGGTEPAGGRLGSQPKPGPPEEARSTDQGKGDKWTRGTWVKGPRGGLSPSSAESSVSGRGRLCWVKGWEVNNKGAPGQGQSQVHHAPPRLAVRGQKCSGHRHICRGSGGEAMCVGRPGRPLRRRNTQHPSPQKCCPGVRSGESCRDWRGGIRRSG